MMKLNLYFPFICIIQFESQPSMLYVWTERAVVTSFSLPVCAITFPKNLENFSDWPSREVKCLLSSTRYNLNRIRKGIIEERHSIESWCSDRKSVINMKDRMEMPVIYIVYSPRSFDGNRLIKTSSDSSKRDTFFITNSEATKGNRCYIQRIRWAIKNALISFYPKPMDWVNLQRVKCVLEIFFFWLESIGRMLAAV